MGLDSACFKVIEEGLKAEEITPPPKAADLPHADRGQDRRVAEFFPGVDVAQVDLHRGQGDTGDGVPDGIRIVGERTGVDQDTVCLLYTSPSPRD